MTAIPIQKRWALPIATGLLLLVAWLEAHTPVALTFSSFYFLPVALAAWSGGRSWGLLFALLTGLVWLWADLAMAHPGAGQNAFRALSVGNHVAAYGLAAWMVDRLRRALDEVHSLQGLLPVCAWCRKVRDDQGLWTGVEAYLQGQGARLTHGICPECQARTQAEVETLKGQTITLRRERKAGPKPQ